MSSTHADSLRQKLWQHHPSAFLLAAQLVILVLYAFASDHHIGRTVISALGILVLMLVVWVVIRSPAVSWIAWALGIPAFLLTILSIFIAPPS